MLPLSPQVFAILSGLVRERCGLHHGEASMALFADKVSTRAIEAGFESLLDYYYFLRYDAASGAELDALIEALVVGETYFYREADQLAVLVREWLLPMVRAHRRPRVWFAACATGEEPLTVAMMLAEHGALGEVELVATDISLRALARARAGTYRDRALRALPPSARRWIVSTGSEHVVSPTLIARIAWSRVNLIAPAEVSALGAFDAIVCRNVLIYFDDATIRGVIERLTASLVPGGRLLVGCSESLLRLGTVLRCEEHGGAFFYTREP
jgi:chemotaxis protein methyltransferase CheR